TATVPALDPAFVAAFRAGTLTAAQAEPVLPEDRAATIFLLLQLSAVLAAPSPPASAANTPSGSLPPYAKPDAPRRRKKRGGQKAHPGHARQQPTHIDRRETHRLAVCPDRGGPLRRTDTTRTRVIEDIPDDLKAEAVEHTVHRDFCPCCRKQVEPPVPDALPHCTLGHRTVALASWLHCGLGVTTSQVADVFNQHLQLKLTAGGLVQTWHRLADLFDPWYEQIHRHCLDAGVLHADETGWRVEGRTWWLWCFSTPDATFYLIDPSRGHPALDGFSTRELDGVLVSDFWAAYDAVGKLQQKCWPHLLRDVKEVSAGRDNGGDWPAFEKRLRRVYGDAIRLVAARAEMTSEVYDRRQALLEGRLIGLGREEWQNAQARRLAKRLERCGGYLLMSVEFPGVPPSNDQAEREVRPAVLMRKASYGNQSDRGAHTRGVLMTVFRTLKRRGLEPLAVIADALRTYTVTGKLPPLPAKIGS
ncbi:MAG: IS66 family transposase, partial [Gemmataceae bacterium]